MDESNEYEVPPAVLEALEDQLTEDMLVRLIAYALSKQKRRFWQGIYGGEMPEGFEPGDIVDQAVEKVLDGRRRWNPEKDPDLFGYLSSVIDSDISSLVHSVANRRIRRESSLGRNTMGDEDESEGFFDQVKSDTEDPEESLQRKEAEDFFWELHEELDDEPLLQKILECVFQGMTRPSEMANEIGVKTKEINNAKKRLKRRVERFRATKQVV